MNLSELTLFEHFQLMLQKFTKISCRHFSDESSCIFSVCTLVDLPVYNGTIVFDFHNYIMICIIIFTLSSYCCNIEVHLYLMPCWRLFELALQVCFVCVPCFFISVQHAIATSRLHIISKQSSRSIETLFPTQLFCHS